MDNSYVYAYLDPQKPGKYSYGPLHFDYEPFYIGKGKNNRCFAHLKEWSLNTSSHKNNKLRKMLSDGNKPIIIKIRENLSDEHACKIEMEYIALVGRANTTGGPLTNNTDGGETSAGAIYSDESKALMSYQRKGKKQTPAQYAANCSRTLSDEHRKKISESQKGIKRLTSEQYKIIAEKNRGKKRSDATKQLLSSQRKGKKQTPAQYAATLEKARRKKLSNDIMPYEEFEKFVSNLDKSYHSARKLIAYVKENNISRIPRNPHQYYKNEWISWNYLFGKT